MPKVIKTKKKNINNENMFSLTKIVAKQQPKSVYKFDINRILKERQAENDELLNTNDEYVKQIEGIVDLFEEKINSNNIKKPEATEFGYVIFDQSKYNLLFKINDTTDLYLQQFFQMSIEENELEADILFYNLKNINWSPIFNDIQNIFYNWGADSDTLLNRPVLCEMNKEVKIGCHNFELIMKYILHCIINNNKLSHSDLLTLAKMIVTISFDSHCGQMICVIKQLFSVCIENALSAEDDAPIIVFAQGLYSQYTEVELMEMIVCLFLPLEGYIMRRMYCYFTYKLFKLFIGSINNMDAFPTNINNWFVQDLVPKQYFIQNPGRVQSVITLLEHVVFVLNLYENEEKLQMMYNYLYSLARSFRVSLVFINILDQWKLRLFRLHVYRVNNSI